MTEIVTALIAGAAAGGQEAASAAVRDAYLAIRNRISRSGDAESAVAIEANEAEPGGDIPAIEAAVVRADVVDDADLRAAVVRLLAAVPSTHADLARTHIDATHAKGVQFGNGNIQNNTFH
ncbi:hypothetical protein [Nocardia carnea]|uniref:RHIM domain-containing protein n=1 Tax=Nocardia carnea TaxID=37328 RepID=A0ABW7TGZ2_9NOCA|nr:hypothetical protein [Nocardia carnea]